MGRNYAGVLGLLAFTVVLARGLRHGGGAESVLLSASISLVVFALLGTIVGALATWIVEDSVKSQVAAEVAAFQAKPDSTSRVGAN